MCEETNECFFAGVADAADASTAVEGEEEESDL